MEPFGTTDTVFIEIGCSQENKAGNFVCGDTFLSHKNKNNSAYLSVLSDGLGSGIKANVLSTMTASMAMNFLQQNEPIVRSAISILNTLPMDSIRNVSYATFSLASIDNDGETTIVEFDNPSFLLFREKINIKPQKEKVLLPNSPEHRIIRISKLKLFKGDRIILFSDGVNQSGIGRNEYPFGWDNDGVEEFVQGQIDVQPDISAHDLAKCIVRQAIKNDRFIPKDDISCAVIYLRDPRRLLICSGPPFNNEKDEFLASTVDNYPGKTIICGGTTSQIIARELHRQIQIDLDIPIGDLPPSAKIKGVNLVTEGILTLGAVAEILENNPSLDSPPDNPAGNIVKRIRESDMIDLMVGTRINEAHQDPSLPVELEIRRNVIKKIAFLLEDKYLKKVRLQFI